ncbi:uncharacterized protein Z518_02419 [Rhinocladiella mackenziei CBS 650.93]|uniref:Rhinocladiella mackenziei CBS 650.93 unplaced genomic scaffold supercont1.2, whole genome shotgun sequence n=1 Tax=Rhinocladiella mackenziei CBS 650.93 TaxID=1442369 RepID=A0A0D2JEZ3_9EURO|nr:uncharacterized protein Z518_02419 [Rhinocladiella mackenziei CBS 650.93]KIX07765.1 hypothetical protein Z518_02419 [Rhinocladiella mackenziei CBS 650.93]
MNQKHAQPTSPEITPSHQFGILTKSMEAHTSEHARLENSRQKWHFTKKSQYIARLLLIASQITTAKDLITKELMNVAEINLNYRLRPRKESLSDLSFRPYEIYQRPASYIMVMIATELAIFLAERSDSAYYRLGVTALPSDIAVHQKIRRSHHIQDFMLDTLLISPKRGGLLGAVAEENWATNGMTVLQEIEQLEMQSSEEHGPWTAFSSQRSRRSKKPNATAFPEKIRVGFPPLRVGTPLH